MSAAWTALAIGAGLGILAYTAIATASRQVRRSIKRQGCPLCGHQPATEPDTITKEPSCTNASLPPPLPKPSPPDVTPTA